MDCLVLGLFVLLGLVVGVNCSRAARLKRMAHTLGLHYDKNLPFVLTPQQTEVSYFFRQGKHYFKHILTCQESEAFIRICEDVVTTQLPKAHAKSTCTLATAELTQGTFCPFILMPRRTNETIPSGSLPTDLASKYVLSAPADFALPDAVLGLLRATGPCYLELTKYALIYHQFNTQPVNQIQPLRYRVVQLVKEFVKNPQQASSAPVPPAVSPDAVENQVQLLLKLHSSSHAGKGEPLANTSSNRWIYGVVLFVLLGGMLFVVNYALHHWVAK